MTSLLDVADEASSMTGTAFELLWEDDVRWRMGRVRGRVAGEWPLETEYMSVSEYGGGGTSGASPRCGVILGT